MYFTFLINKMVFNAKKIESAITFGDKLKKYREDAGLTIEKATQLLNIQAKFLEQLERNEIEKLPADVYSRGFLKKYAKLLDIKTEVLLAEYESEVKISEHLSKNVHQSLPVLRARRFFVTPKTIGILTTIVVFIFVVGYLFYQLSFLMHPPKLTVFEPANDMAAAQSAIVVSGRSEPGVKLTINGQEVYINKDGGFSQEVNLNQGLNLIVISAVNRFGKSSSETRKVLLK